MTGSKQFDPTAAPAATSSTAKTAKGQASQVAAGAADAAQYLAGVAKKWMGQVVTATGQQLRRLTGKAQWALIDHADAQQRKVAGGLHSIGDRLKSMTEKSDQNGPATDV